MAGTARRMRTAFALAGAALVLVLLLAAVTGRPVVSYAKSGSMEPTIGTFDVFFVNPWPTTLREGDIIVFHSISRGEASVHRIVGGDRHGWLTQGDANANVDQMGGEPLVTDERILGRVVTGTDGEPILLEGLGLTVVQLRVEWVKLSHKVGGEDRLQTGILGASMALLVVSALRAQKEAPPAPRVPSSPRLRRALRRILPRGILGRHLAGALALTCIASGAYAAAHADSPTDVQMIVVRDPAAAGERAGPPGDTLVRTIEVGSLGLLPAHAFLEPGSDSLRPREAFVHAPSGERVRVEVEQTAGSAIGVQRDTLHVWRYPAWLPASANGAMHAALPGLPYLAAGGALALAAIVTMRVMGVMAMPVAPLLGVREAWP